MSHKELSPYPPDRWIMQMNRKYPNLWTDLRKAYADLEKVIRSGAEGMLMLQAVPDWCIMPTMFPFLLLTHRYGESYYLTHMDEMMTLASACIWRCSKGVYRFAPEIFSALTAQPLTGDLPTDVLYRLPEWAVYIETPGLTYERHQMEGFIAHLDYNLFSRSVDLQFAMFLQGREMPKMVALPLGSGSLADAMDRVDQTDDMFMGHTEQRRYVGSRDEYRRTFSAMLQLMLYLCSEEPDLPEIEHPQKWQTLCGSVRPPQEPRVWDVGVRISHLIRSYRGTAPAAMSISTANVWRRTTCRSRGLPPAMASFRFRTDACSCSAITAPARGTAAAGASPISPSASCRPACWSARPCSRTTAGAASAPSTNREEGTV